MSRSPIPPVRWPALLAVVASAGAAAQSAPYVPAIAPASDEARAAISRFQPADGLSVELVAAEPLLANPVAFHIDDRGTFYVCETFRLHAGVTDNRRHTYWIDDDLACTTVEDRVAKYARHLGDEFDSYAQHHERIRCIFDDDGDGVADRASVFADGFSDAAAGIAAGVLAAGKHVYYTCIPHLWRLEDRDRDGVADGRSALHGGFGVHTALLGHDMHGLCFGPDGRLYFSIGDRGFNVTTAEGVRLEYPHTGAVLRCEPDGSHLEVFASGLRNPQELAFDRWGNLFTGDNNSDGGDAARWVHVVQGGDSGWLMSFQYLGDRGPWNEEKLWHPAFAGQAAWIVPPVANLASGPSGLVYNPGCVALPPRYADHFFLCDFRGASAPSGVHAVRVLPKGAGFELDARSDLIWRVLATDVEFGPDGALYLTDWTEGWDAPGKGRIYRVSAADRRAAPDVSQTAALLRVGFADRSVEELLDLLGHADRRVRQGAQFALAGQGRPIVPQLVAVAGRPGRRIARVHALWALGQVARMSAPDVLEDVGELLEDGDAEIRKQMARVAGDARYVAAAPALIECLDDPSARVRAAAAQALGALGHAPAFAPLCQMLAANADRDPVLRHAGVMGLLGTGDEDVLIEAIGTADPSVRRAVLLALRRLRHAAVARFLDDEERSIVVEAARAIHDVPIEAARPALAAALMSAAAAERPFARRAIAANQWLGTRAAAHRLVEFATGGAGDEEMRALALAALGEWAAPSARDMVLGLWRPLPARDAGDAVAPLVAEFGAAVAAAPASVVIAAIDAARSLKADAVVPELMALVREPAVGATTRATALSAAGALRPEAARAELEQCAASAAPELRRAAVALAAKLEPLAAIPVLAAALTQGELSEQRHALQLLAAIPHANAAALIAAQVEALRAGGIAPELALDVVLAAQARPETEIQDALQSYRDAKPAGDPLRDWSETLVGGDVAAGEKVFREHVSATCTRCHRVAGDGGDAGPVLDGIGADRTRQDLLLALVQPTAAITEGYGTIAVTLDNGTTRVGAVRGESETVLRLKPEGEAEVEIPVSQIAARTEPVSSMPPMGGILTAAQLRDVVAYLASLQER